jgi:2-hydroxy-3-keto-5-methylthiopentenyl-1-phosphate phosphatase
MNRLSNSITSAAHAQKPIVFCDFDGTVTLADVTDCILEELADPSWRELEAAWVGGQIGSRECLERQMALVRASSKELNTLIDGIAVDPGFASFHRFTEKCRLPFYILSDGFDYVIRRVLRRAGVDGELRNGKHLFTSALQLDGNRLRVSFPHDAKVCEHGCATCKAAIIRRVGRSHQPVIFIGDGLSDRFALEESDLIFAKKQLLAYCQKNSIACLPFDTFAEIEGTLAELFAMTTAGVSKGGRRKAKSSKLLEIGAHPRVSFAD